jgi:hypothetical protein
MNASVPKSERPSKREPFFGDEGVTPILGAIILLGISIVGIAAILLWGAPAVQMVQEQGAQDAMIGEFYGLRTLSLGLSITETSRIPGVSVAQGTFGVVPGTRIEVSADLDATCRMDITEIAETTIALTATDCGTLNDSSGVACGGGHTCLTINRIDSAAPGQTSAVVSGGMAPAGPTNSAGGVDFVWTTTGSDMRVGGWMIELRTFGATAPLSQAWVEDTMAHHWRLRGATEVQLHHEAGAIFSNIDTGVFLVEAPPMSEEAFNLEWFWLHMPIFSGRDIEITGKLTTEVLLELDASPLRITSENLYRMRFSFIGDYAEGWCNGLLLRNNNAPGVWSSLDACASGTDARRVAQYVPQNVPDELEFTHAYITTSI